MVVTSEDAFAVEAVPLSPHIKILTDSWECDLIEDTMAFDPSKVVAGLEPSQPRHDADWMEMFGVIEEYHRCVLSANPFGAV